MLRYLNGNASVVGAPNENYARELLELFTVGKGPLIGTGNYTNYTEADVQAAARCSRVGATMPLPWRATSWPAATILAPSSSAVPLGMPASWPIGPASTRTLSICYSRKLKRRTFLVRTLYCWVVYYVIDSQIENDVIQPLATILIQNSYEVAPVLRALLGSQHFFDAANVGCLIKNPVDFTVGACRQPELAFPPASSVVAHYGM